MPAELVLCRINTHRLVYRDTKYLLHSKIKKLTINTCPHCLIDINKVTLKYKAFITLLCLNGTNKVTLGR